MTSQPFFFLLAKIIRVQFLFCEKLCLHGEGVWKTIRVKWSEDNGGKSTHGRTVLSFHYLIKYAKCRKLLKAMKK